MFIAGVPIEPRNEIWVAALVLSFIVLGIGNAIFLHINRNAALKRRLFPAIMFTASLIFCGVGYFAADREAASLFFPALVLIPIFLINIRATRFCNSCGRTQFKQPLFTKARPCEYCGAEPL